MKVLTKRQILLLHRQLIEQTGGSDGIRDEGLLDSAMAAPFQSFDNADAYPSLQQKAARLCFGLVKNHPFILAQRIFQTRNGKICSIFWRRSTDTICSIKRESRRSLKMAKRG